MRLLLDEHYSPSIAEQLRDRGHDVVSAAERASLRGVSDRELLDRAAGEGRALVTENVADFMPLIREAAAGGERHLGVIFTSPRSLPRAADTIGLFVQHLDALLREHTANEALTDQVRWLSPK